MIIFSELKAAPPPKTRNLLYSQPGVVTVYIRPGNTPLESISPDLAEAFEFNAVKHGRLAFGRQINEILNEKKENPGLFNSGQLAEGESYTLKQKKIGKSQPKETVVTHIQKIAKN